MAKPGKCRAGPLRSVHRVPGHPAQWSARQRSRVRLNACTAAR